MSRKGKFIQTEGDHGSPGLGMGMRMTWGDGNVLKLDCGDC